VKLLFDECIGYGIYEAICSELNQLLSPIQHVHMLDFTGRQGVADEVWVPRAALEKWMVITGDSGRSKQGAPLQLLLPRNGISGIYFSGKLQSKPAQTKVEAVLDVSGQLPDIYNGPPGTRHRLRMKHQGYSLQPWPL
jgi:hypothetical protein